MSLICNRFLILRPASTCITPPARLPAFSAFSPLLSPPRPRLSGCFRHTAARPPAFSSSTSPPTRHTAAAHPLSPHCRRFFHFFRFFRRFCFAFNPKSYTFLHFPTLSYTPETRSPSNFPTLSYTSYASFVFLSLPALSAFLHLPPSPFSAPSPYQVRSNSAPRLHLFRFNSAPSTHVNPTLTPPKPVHLSLLRSKHEAKEERRSPAKIR